MDIDEAEPVKTPVTTPSLTPAASVAGPAASTTGSEDVPSEAAKDLADAGDDLNDAAMNDGELLPGELPEEGGDELPAPEEQDAAPADDLDLFAPKTLAKVPDLLAEAVTPGRAAVQHEPLSRSAIISLCRMYPALAYDLKLPLLLLVLRKWSAYAGAGSRPRKGRARAAACIPVDGVPALYARADAQAASPPIRAAQRDAGIAVQGR
ncbi:hypothetical protein PAPYR_12997 [Paratrimastix pyriformis]|uniref:Uncharacterized protein n=1 Tax=Paratrimastix pyriformis TaxID=342808 RepID=A0ABQ8U641_9EUKA|nr:hypothetical protein PAPYR_12997 [Paratrimastix pyriformis]